MRRLGLVLGAASLFVALMAISGARRFARVAVSGHSMEPGLHDGDWLLVDRSAISFKRGDIVVARDPRARARLIIKRVGEVATDTALMLVSDHPAHADDLIGPVPVEDVVGRARLRYWPLDRVALIGRGSAGAPYGGWSNPGHSCIHVAPLDIERCT